MKKKVSSKLLQEIVQEFERGPIPKELLEIPFVEALWPWMGAARARLREIGANTSLLEPKALLEMEGALLRRWSHDCAPSMVLELGVSRLSGALKGTSSQERYGDFIRQRLGDEAALFSFFDEYAELERRVGLLLDLWVAQAAEFLQRLMHDLPLLADFFNEGRPFGKVVLLAPSAGDVHNGGRSVYILEFGCGKKLLYKPKDLRIVAAFHHFLEGLNERGLTPKLAGYKVLVREGYGWEEWVEQKACADSGEARRYFERAGMLLCLMYLLDGRDVHYENLIACGEFPFLIDLETLFHAELSDLHLDHYVLRTGMLPTFVFGDLGKPGVDISALGAQPGQHLLSRQPRWEGLGSDEMRLVQGVGSCEGDCKRMPFAAKDYVEEIALGFRKMYAFVFERRAPLLQELLAMANFPVRFILRLTAFYARLLQRLSDPQVILNPALVSQELEALPKYLIEKGKEELIALVDEERRALLQGDLPFFTSIPSQPHLFAGGRVILAHALKKPSFETVRERIEGMSGEDAALQESYIRHSFLIKSGAVHSDGEARPLVRASAFSKEQKMAEVLHIAEGLKKRSCSTAKGNLIWIDLEGDPLTGQYALQPLSDNLYGGRMGIALFFAALYHTSCDIKWKQLALSSLHEVRQKIEEGLAGRLIAQLGLGGFTGVGGLIYGLSHCARLLHEPALADLAHRLVRAIEKRHIQESSLVDVVGGCAGLLLALLSLPNCDAFALRVAKLCGDHLCERTAPLLGFSHGAAGISYALFKLASRVQNKSYEVAARRAMNYERSLFNPAKKNWPHLGMNPQAYMTSWCHGATGIGLGRLASLDFFKEWAMEEEIEIALETTQRDLHRGDSSNLCCSTLGRIEFLREAAKRLGRPHLNAAASEAIAVVLSQLNDEQIKPGLMQGAAGLGYTLLRLQDETGALPQLLLLS